MAQYFTSSAYIGYKNWTVITLMLGVLIDSFAWLQANGRHTTESGPDFMGLKVEILLFESRILCSLVVANLRPRTSCSSKSRISTKCLRFWSCFQRRQQYLKTRTNSSS